MADNEIFSKFQSAIAIFIFFACITIFSGIGAAIAKSWLRDERAVLIGAILGGIFGAIVGGFFAWAIMNS